MSNLWSISDDKKRPAPSAITQLERVADRVQERYDGGAWQVVQEVYR